MLKYSKDGISVFAILDRRRIKTNGLFPVKVEVIYRRQQKYFPTGVDMSEMEWQNVSGTRKTSEDVVRIENTFHNIRTEVETLLEKGRWLLAGATWSSAWSSVSWVWPWGSG